MRIFWLPVLLVLCHHRTSGDAYQLNIHKFERVVCYFNSSSVLRAGEAEFSVTNFKILAPTCTDLIWSFAGIDHDTYKVQFSNPKISYKNQNSSIVNSTLYDYLIELKKDSPHLKIHLSISGDTQPLHKNLYRAIIQHPGRQRAFIDSVKELLKNYDFDGIDLATDFQYIRVLPKGPIMDTFDKVVDWMKSFFNHQRKDDENITNDTAYAQFVLRLKDTLTDKSITLTILPPATPHYYYYHLKDLETVVDAIHLLIFNILTPNNSPKHAYHSAPLHDRLSTDVDSIIQAWLNLTSAHKLVLGIPAFGNIWRVNKTDKFPLPANGPFSPVSVVQTPGVITQNEICLMNAHDTEGHVRTNTSRLQGVSSYGFMMNGKDGFWASYEDTTTTFEKVNYAARWKLDGVALFDLSTDAYTNGCDPFPILHSIKFAVDLMNHLSNDPKALFTMWHQAKLPQ